jgi:hypothetical protein
VPPVEYETQHRSATLPEQPAQRELEVSIKPVLDTRFRAGMRMHLGRRSIFKRRGAADLCGRHRTAHAMTRPRPALEHSPTLALRHTAPDPELGLVVQRVGKTLGDHRAADADPLGGPLGSTPDEQGIGRSLPAGSLQRRAGCMSRSSPRLVGHLSRRSTRVGFERKSLAPAATGVM